MTASVTLCFTKKTSVPFSFVSHLSLIYITISLIFEKTRRKISTTECKNSKARSRKCKIRKCISLQNVPQDILQYDKHLPLNKVHNEIHTTAQICTTMCTTRCTTCCPIKCIKNLDFLCVLVLLNRRKAKFASSINCSSYQQRHSTDLINTNCFIKSAT